MSSYSYKKDGSIRDFQRFIEDVYSDHDDRLYSIHDLIVQIQRFMMRALKGIRKSDKPMARTNMLIALSWFMAVCSRLHVDIEDEVWKRFPYVCSYCGLRPCACKELKPKARKTSIPDDGLRPKTLKGFQKMHAEIYPPDQYTVFEAGVHAGEETGEIAEAVYVYLGQHDDGSFEDVRLELADFISCLFDVANAMGMDVADGLAAMYPDNCHMCHKAPCICSFAAVAKFKA